MIKMELQLNQDNKVFLPSQKQEEFDANFRDEEETN